MLNAEGDVELDALIMDGRTLGSGAVSSVKNIPNPVSLARAVMEKVLTLNTPHSPRHQSTITHLTNVRLMPLNFPDSPFAVDQQRREPVC